MTSQWSQSAPASAWRTAGSRWAQSAERIDGATIYWMSRPATVNVIGCPRTTRAPTGGSCVSMRAKFEPGPGGLDAEAERLELALRGLRVAADEVGHDVGLGFATARTRAGSRCAPRDTTAPDAGSLATMSPGPTSEVFARAERTEPQARAVDKSSRAPRSDSPNSSGMFANSSPSDSTTETRRPGFTKRRGVGVLRDHEPARNRRVEALGGDGELEARARE